MNKLDEIKKEYQEKFGGTKHKLPLIKVITQNDVWNSYHFVASDELGQFITKVFSAGVKEGGEKKVEEIRETIEESMIRKNDRNRDMYEVEIDNYNMALSDLLELLTPRKDTK